MTAEHKALDHSSLFQAGLQTVCIEPIGCRFRFAAYLNQSKFLTFRPQKTRREPSLFLHFMY